MNTQPDKMDFSDLQSPKDIHDPMLAAVAQWALQVGQQSIYAQAQGLDGKKSRIQIYLENTKAEAIEAGRTEEVVEAIAAHFHELGRADTKDVLVEKKLASSQPAAGNE